MNAEPILESVTDINEKLKVENRELKTELLALGEELELSYVKFDKLKDQLLNIMKRSI